MSTGAVPPDPLRDEPDYVAAHVVSALACDRGTHQLGVAVVAHGGRLQLSGELPSEPQRRRVLDVATAAAPGWEVIDDLEVRTARSRPVGEERL